MSDLQKFLDDELKKIRLDQPEEPDWVEDYDVFRELARALVAARTEAGLTQGELAKLCGVSQANISKFETGSGHPTLPTLKKIADGLGKRLAVLFLDSEVNE